MQSRQVPRAQRVFPCTLILPLYLFATMHLHLKVTNGEKLHLVGSLALHMICFLFLAGSFLYAQGSQSLFLVKYIPRREGSAGWAVSV